MEITLFTIILTMFCQNAVTAQKTLQNNRLLFDLTRPVNELIGEEISKQDFLLDIHSAFSLIGANVTTSSVFYEAAGDTIEELESRAEVACGIIHKTLNLTFKSQIIISLRINGTTKDTLNLSRLYNKTFDGYKPKIILPLNDGTACDGLSKHPIDPEIKELLASNNELLVGVSLDESLIRCHSFDDVKKSASILVVNLKFGTTRGVTESFGLFQARMTVLSDSVKNNDTNEQIIYYPNPFSVGENEHQNLLIHYASIWTTFKKTQGSILLQIPNSRYNASSTTQFSIIPKLAFEQYRVGIPDEEIQLSLLLFAASFRRHQVIFVDEYLWKLWNTVPEKVIQTLKLHKNGLPINVVLDCFSKKCEWLNTNSYQRSHLNVVATRTIVFKITEERSANLPYETAKQISPNLTIGCTYQPDMRKNFQSLTESNIENVVRACQSFNGTVFILTVTLKLKSFDELAKYSFHFENNIRKELHAVNQFRKGILERIPKTKVYLQLDIVESESLNSNSLFCGEFAGAGNVYLEGIFNWAKLENFPVINRIDNHDSTSYFPQWFNLLRRLNYPYPNWAEKEGIRDQLPTSPAFLMQGYSRSANNWEPDSCLDWTETRWEIDDEFFYNLNIGKPTIGTVFHPNDNLCSSALKKIDYITMLDLVFSRFELVEINISFDFSTFLAALEWYFAKLVNEDTKIIIFMKYARTEKDHMNELEAFTSVFDEFKSSLIYEVGKYMGIHAELVEDSSNFESVLGMMNYAKLSNHTRGIELPSVKVCYQMLHKFIFNEEYSELINTINYLVCKEDINVFMGNCSKVDLQRMLDSHLALKRSLHQMIPHLQVYFSVQYDFEINFENNKTLDRYISFVTLFNTFGTEHDIKYFIIDAFDSKLKTKKTGWWEITNYMDLASPQSYVEKVFSKQQRENIQCPQTSTTSLSSVVSNTQDFSLVILVSSISSVVLLLLVILGIFFGLRYRKLQHLSRFLSDSEVQEFLNGRVSAKTDATNLEMETMGSVVLEHLKFNQDYKLNLTDLTIDFEKILGSGAFGMVYKGLTRNIPAAVKRPNADCSKTTFKSVLTEVKVLAYVGCHPNVVGFLGAYVEEIHKGTLYISTELCSIGSLEGFLRKKTKVISQTAFYQDPNIEPQTCLYFHDLNTFAMEIAQGMEYIESKRVVHGDLSTRNVLLDENLVCKIGDFGLSRKLYEYQKYVKSSQEPLPWKWMAHESLTKMEFTSKTDVWSYGVTLWEIYTLGKIPYAGLNWTANFANELQNGLRLPNPDFASSEIYAKLLECWNINPDERPTFTDMKNFFKGLSGDTYMILNPVEQQHDSTVE